MAPKNARGQLHSNEPRRNRLQQEQEFEAFLMCLKQCHGFDIGVYQRPYLRVQLEKRLQLLHLKCMGDYWDYL